MKKIQQILRRGIFIASFATVVLETEIVYMYVKIYLLDLKFFAKSHFRSCTSQTNILHNKLPAETVIALCRLVCTWACARKGSTFTCTRTSMGLQRNAELGDSLETKLVVFKFGVPVLNTFYAHVLKFKHSIHSYLFTCTWIHFLKLTCNVHDSTFTKGEFNE